MVILFDSISRCIMKAMFQMLMKWEQLEWTKKIIRGNEAHVTLKVQFLKLTRFCFMRLCKIWMCWCVVGWIVVSISFVKRHFWGKSFGTYCLKTKNLWIKYSKKVVYEKRHHVIIFFHCARCGYLQKYLVQDHLCVQINIYIVQIWQQMRLLISTTW
jgi:hypothetical protein